MKKNFNRFLLTGILSISVHFSFSQITFQKTYGTQLADEGYSANEYPGGGYIIAGYTTNPVNQFYKDIFILRTDVNGDTLWTKIFSGPKHDSAGDLIINADGSIVITGWVNIGANLFDNAALIKLDSLGNIIWAKSISGNNDGTDECYSICQSFDGGYAIGGYSYIGGGNPILQAFIAKTDSVGNLEWARSYGDGSQYFWTGSCVRQTSDSGFILVGGAHTISGFDNLVVKTDKNGNMLWTKASTTGTGIGSDAVEEVNNGYLIASNTGSSEIVMYLLDFSGNILWSTSINTNMSLSFLRMSRTHEGKMILCGGTQDVLIIKIDPTSGAGYWAKTFGGANADIGSSVQETSDHGFLICGTTFSYGAGERDMFLIKTDSIGNVSCGTNIPIVNYAVATLVVDTLNVLVDPTGHGFNDTLTVSSGCSITDVCNVISVEQNMEHPKVIVYPNPVSSSAFIQFDQVPENADEIRFLLFDVLGEKIVDRNIFELIAVSKNSFRLDRKSLPPGIYFYSVSDGNKNLTQGKIAFN